MHEPISGVPNLRPARFSDSDGAALRLGLARISRRTPFYGLIFAGFYILAGWVMTWIDLADRAHVLAGAGDDRVSAAWPLCGRWGFTRCPAGSKRGLPVHGRRGLRGDLASAQPPIAIALRVMVVIFLFWFFLGHMIFALFLGLTTMTNISSSSRCSSR